MKVRRVENPPGVELLLRVVAEEVGQRRCARCDASLDGAPIGLGEQDAAQVVIKVSCQACGESTVVRIQPGLDEGIASVS